MRSILVLTSLFIFAAVHAQDGIPRPPGWYPTPPGGSVAAHSFTPPSLDSVVKPKFASLFATETKFVVDVPSDAKVYVDGQPTTSQGSERQYTSDGQSGEYTFTAEVQRGSSIFRSSRRARVNPGGAVRLSFSELNDCSGGS